MERVIPDPAGKILKSITGREWWTGPGKFLCKRTRLRMIDGRALWNAMTIYSPQIRSSTDLVICQPRCPEARERTFHALQRLRGLRQLETASEAPFTSSHGPPGPEYQILTPDLLNSRVRRATKRRRPMPLKGSERILSIQLTKSMVPGPAEYRWWPKTYKFRGLGA